MSSFLIMKTDAKKRYKDIKLTGNGYDFKPNIVSDNVVVLQITLYNDAMIKTILTKKIEKNFKRVASIVYDVIASDDDSSTSDAIIALDEVAKLRAIMLNKYQKFLKKELEEEYLKKLRFLENELRSKIALYQYQNQFEEERGHGR